MSKEWKSKKSIEKASPEKELPIQNIENQAPRMYWANFDDFWHSSVKGGSQLIKESAFMHLKAMGWANKQDKWIEGMRHFGLKIED